MMNQDKVAYLILAHADPYQFQRLVNTLDYCCDFYVHIDSYSEIRSFQKLRLPKNVTFISKREKINWGGFSMVKATISLIQEALNSGVSYSHFVLLSGADYPIKSPKQICDYLFSNPDRQFIKFTYMEDSPEWYMPMLTRYYFRDVLPFMSSRQTRRIARYVLENSMKPFRRNYLKGIKPCAGSQWWGITLDCAKYIIDFVNSNQHFFNFYKNTFVPDEHFFHTIVGNSKYLEQTFFERTTLKGPHEFANFHIIHPSLKKTYTLMDFDEIKSSDKFFVRKVNSVLSKDLMDQIDAQLLESENVNLERVINYATNN